MEAQLIKTGVIVCCAGGSFTKLTHQGNNVVGYFNRQRSLALRAIDMEAHLDDGRLTLSEYSTHYTYFYSVIGTYLFIHNTHSINYTY